jgi:transposase
MVANRTAQVDQIRGLLDEFGLVVPKGVPRLRRELPGILEDAADGLPELAREVLAGCFRTLRRAGSCRSFLKTWAKQRSPQNLIRSLTSLNYDLLS